MTTHQKIEDFRFALTKALIEFRNYDLSLLERDVNERAISHQIGCYLKNEFSDPNVDCEYNRLGNKPKNSSDGELILPDIVIHRRGVNEKNLLVIEIKKSTNRDIEPDKKKLLDLTKIDGKFQYQLGLLLILTMKKPYGIHEKWYRNGMHLLEYDRSISFDEMTQ